MEKETERDQRVGASFPRIVFLGTPDFAVPSLQLLISRGAPIVGVVTQPDRPKGRGAKVAPPPVKMLAENMGIPIFQPQRVRAEAFIEELRSLNGECAVVVAYGQLLPQALLDLYPLGAINVHASLLPRHRGAAPIQRSLLAGDASTGVSIMVLDAGMDTGPVLSRQEIPVGEDDCFGTIHDKLARLGAELLCETLVEWRAGRIVPQVQDGALATLAPPVRKEEYRLDWQLPAREIVNRIRALDPVPGAFAFYRGKRLKCFRGTNLPWRENGGRAGEVVGTREDALLVLGGDGNVLGIGAVQLEGQRRMSASEFLRGHPLPPGTVLE